VVDSLRDVDCAPVVEALDDVVGIPATRPVQAVQAPAKALAHPDLYMPIPQSVAHWEIGQLLLKYPCPE